MISKSEQAAAKHGEKRLMVKVIKAVGLGLKQGIVSRSTVGSQHEMIKPLDADELKYKLFLYLPSSSVIRTHFRS